MCLQSDPAALFRRAAAAGATGLPLGPLGGFSSPHHRYGVGQPQRMMRHMFLTVHASRLLPSRRAAASPGLGWLLHHSGPGNSGCLQHRTSQTCNSSSRAPVQAEKTLNPKPCNPASGSAAEAAGRSCVDLDFVTTAELHSLHLQADQQLQAAGAAAHSEAARRLLHDGTEPSPDAAWGGSLPKKVSLMTTWFVSVCTEIHRLSDAQ